MKTNSERAFINGVLVVTDVPTFEYEGDEQIAVSDAALITGYAAMLEKSNVIGQVTVSLDELKQKFSVEDFLPKSS